MLQIKNLTITLTKDVRTILEGFNFTLNDGDKAVIIGEEGNGKSTLLKLIYDPALVDGYAEYSGEIITHGTRFGYLAQDMVPEEKQGSVYELFCSVPGFFDVTPKEAAKLTHKLGLTPDIFYSDQLVGTLSGGERVKVQLLRILIQYPQALLLDEPSNDIDIETLEWLESFINESDIPVLFVSHDETLIENTANTIIHIEQLRRKTVPRYTVAKSGYRDYIDARERGFAHQEQVARKEKSEFDARVERFRKIEQKVKHGLDTVSRADPHSGQLMKKKMKAVKAQEHRLDKDRDNLTQLPDTEDAIMIKFSTGINIPNGKTVLDFSLDELSSQDGRVLAKNIKLNIMGPEKICIIGKNGIGKTTLTRMIAGDMLARNDLKCAYMPQNYEDELDFTQTPVEILAENGDKASVTRAKTFLGSMKYTPDEMEHCAGDLSGGQKAKLLFLKMILDGAEVLLLDEPTRNFSPMSNPVIRKILCEFGGVIISVSHDRKYISQVCTKIYRLTEDGLIKEYEK